MAYKQPLTTTSWTPTITFGGGSTGITYSTQTGVYTRIGNIVFYQFNIVLTNKGSSTGNVMISGIPFSANGAWEGTLRSANLTYTGTSVTIQSNATVLNLINSLTGSSGAALTDTAFSNNTSLIGSGTYQISGVST